jgi:DNA-binding transcriptional LysR family regulator
MDIYQLEYALAVAHYQHFSHAADEICVSQSTLSHQINKLEEELGVRLFKRTTRTVYLTAAGEEFIAYATRIMSEIKQAKQAMRQHAMAERGQIIIGAIPTIGLLKLTTALAEFQRSYPNLQMDIQEDFSGRLLEMLLASEIDVGLLTPPSGSLLCNNICYYPLISDELVLTVHRNHPLSTEKIIHLNAARNEKHIIMKPNNGLRTIVLDACRNAGFEPNIVYQSRQVETVLGLVSEGLGVALMTSRVANYLKQPAYAIVRLHDAPKRVTALAILRHERHSPAVKVFQSFMIERFKAR